jgi:O-antigen ligase
MAYKRQLLFVKTGFSIPIFLFLGLIVFQLVPLPLNLIRLISFNTANLYEKFLPDGATVSFFTLSLYPNATISELLKLLSYMGIFFLIINKIETRWQIDFILNLIIFFGLFVSIFGLAQRYINPTSTSFGPFVNRNNFAGYINMIIPLALGYFLTDMPLSKRLIYAVSTGIMSLALFMSLVRAGVFVFIVILFFAFTLSRLKYSSLREKSGILGLFFIVLVCISALFINTRVVWERLSTLFRKETFAILGHGYSWLDILRICRDFLIFGTGLGTFGNISSMYKTTSLQMLFIYAHNDLLQLLSDVGLIGFSFIALFFSLYFSSIIKTWRSRHDPYIVPLLLGGMCSILGMLVYSILDFNLHIPANALLFFIIIGLVYRLNFIRSYNAICS